MCINVSSTSMTEFKKKYKQSTQWNPISLYLARWTCNFRQNIKYLIIQLPRNYEKTIWRMVDFPSEGIHTSTYYQRKVSVEFCKYYDVLYNALQYKSWGDTVTLRNKPLKSFEASSPLDKLYNLILIWFTLPGWNMPDTNFKGTWGFMTAYPCSSSPQTLL